MANLNTKHLQSEVERLARLINLPSELYPKFEMPLEPTYDYDTYIILEGEHYSFWCSEPMGAFVRIRTDSLDDLLYCVFESLTSDMAEAMSKKEFLPGVEVRRLIWAKQLKLMDQLSSKWSHRLAVTISEILIKHPPRDGLGDIAKQIELHKFIV